MIRFKPGDRVVYTGNYTPEFIGKHGVHLGYIHDAPNSPHRVLFDDGVVQLLNPDSISMEDENL